MPKSARIRGDNGAVQATTAPRRVAILWLEDESEPPADPSFWVRALSPSDASTPPPARQTVADFWNQCSDGGLALRVDRVIRRRLPANDPDWVTARSSTDPDSETALATAKLVRRSIGLSQWLRLFFGRQPRVLVVISSAPVVRAYAVAPWRGGPLWPIALFDRASTHHTVAHEIGHLLGFAHPWGLTEREQGYAGGEYGSPYCVMGTAGRLSEVCRSLEPWPATGDSSTAGAFWTRAGPRLSRASLLATYPKLSASSTQTVPLGDEPVEFTLTDTAGPAGLPRAVLLARADHDLVIEVRRPRSGSGIDWDSRLDLRRSGGPTLLSDRDLHDGPGLVVHRLDRPPGSDRKAPRRVTYLGSVPVPPGGVRDLSVAPDVRLTLLSDDGSQVVARAERGADVRIAEICVLTDVCRKDRGRVRPWRVRLHGHVYGATQPHLVWQVAGRELSASPGRGKWTKVQLPVTVGDQTVPVAVEVDMNWDEIALQIDPCPVGFELPISLASADPDDDTVTKTLWVPPSRPA